MSNSNGGLQQSALKHLANCKEGTMSQNDPPDRTALPIPEPYYPPITEIDVRKATAPPRFEVKPPPGAPNVLLILLDNLGYAASKAFGGLINMPTLERLAENG